MRQLKSALFLLRSTGESAFFVAEKLTADEFLWQSAAVYRDERCLVPTAFLVNGVRHQLLAGAALTLDENVDIRRR